MSGCLCSGRQEGVLRLQNSSGVRYTHPHSQEFFSGKNLSAIPEFYMFSPRGDLLIETPKLSMFESRTGISSHRVCLKYLDVEERLKKNRAQGSWFVGG